jgi:DNA polymerase-3 subunit gamma/tau
MSYLVLARKWRPQSFEEVIGQHHITKTLQNAIANDRVAHAFLFAGARGVGKTSMARILAKALNCREGPKPSPCNGCENCKEISSGNSMDVLEIDGASNRGINEIRELRETVKYTPAKSAFKILIIDPGRAPASRHFHPCHHATP